MITETQKLVSPIKPADASHDRSYDLSDEYGRLARLREEIDSPESFRNILLSERIRRVDERIDAIEDELSYEMASSLAGALGQAVLASADIAYMLETDCDPKHERRLKERVQRLLWSITKILEHNSGIDMAAVYGSHAPIDPFKDLLSPKLDLLTA